MQLVDQKERNSGDELEPVLYAALVDSMCQNFWPMFIGSVSSAVAAVLTALKTGNVLLWPCAALIIGIGTVRAFQMRKYERRTQVLSFEQAKHLEPRYAIGAMVYASVLGVWCFLTIFGNDDAVAHMICVAATVGYTAGGAARNYGRPKLIQYHILLACGPMSLALATHADFFYISLAALLALFFMGLKGINLSLHAIFVKALTSSFREAALAGQFDTALNNMPHGLCMFSSDGRLAVMNHRFSEMMNLSDDLIQRGAGAPDIIAACITSDSITAASGKMILSEIVNTQAGDIITTDPDVKRSRSLSWTFQPMIGGGAVVLVEDITERRNAEARISHLARYDELTALPNRVNFRDEIGRLLAIQQGAEHLSALLFVDLDQFKQVNDTLGHPCGDQLLCAVADRLREMLRPEDFVARFGGDEFVVFQQNIHSADDAAGLARRIVDRLSERYKIDNHLVEIGASVGIAMTSRGVSADTLLKNADMALYRAKADGRGTFCFFRDEMAQVVEFAPYPRAGSAQGAGERGIRAVLSAAGQRQIGQDIHLRSAAALELSGPRHGLPGRHHSGRRGYGPDRRPRPLDFAQGLHGMHEVARSRQRRGQFLAAAIPSARRAERSPLRARGLRPGSEPARNRDHRILAAAEHAADARCVVATAFPRRADLARRFRHRLFKPELPA